MSSGASNILVYVDHPLATAVAANMVGVVKTDTVGQKTTAGFNWLVSTGYIAENSRDCSFDIRELLPEDLLYAFYPNILEKHSSIDTGLVSRLTAGSGNSLIPGSVLSVSGKVRFLGLNGPPQDVEAAFSGAEIDAKTVPFHGDTCIVAELLSGDYRVPVYFPEAAKYQVVYCHDQPVEVTGILRWVPPYSPGGGRSLNLAIRCVAIWLR